MKRLVLLFLLYFSTSVSATECDCSIYPFKPNPPCFSNCYSKLPPVRNIDLSSIKNLNLDVFAAIPVRSKSKDQNSIKFESINGEADLKRAAASDGRIDYANANQHSYLLYSLAFFGLWLLIYMLYWIFSKSFHKGGNT